MNRRCVWTKGGQKFAVWRCASRIDYGTKYCHDSPTLREEPLQAAILAAINTVMSQQETLVGQIEDAMRMELISYHVYMMASANKFLRIYYATVKRYLDNLEA